MAGYLYWKLGSKQKLSCPTVGKKLPFHQLHRGSRTVPKHKVCGEICTTQAALRRGGPKGEESFSLVYNAGMCQHKGPQKIVIFWCLLKRQVLSKTHTHLFPQKDMNETSESPGFAKNSMSYPHVPAKQTMDWTFSTSCRIEPSGC